MSSGEYSIFLLNWKRVSARKCCFYWELSEIFSSKTYFCSLFQPNSPFGRQMTLSFYLVVFSMSTHPNNTNSSIKIFMIASIKVSSENINYRLASDEFRTLIESRSKVNLHILPLSCRRQCRREHFKYEAFIFVWAKEILKQTKCLEWLQDLLKSFRQFEA